MRKRRKFWVFPLPRQRATGRLLAPGFSTRSSIPSRFPLDLRRQAIPPLVEVSYRPEVRVLGSDLGQTRAYGANPQGLRLKNLWRVSAAPNGLRPIQSLKEM